MAKASKSKDLRRDFWKGFFGGIIFIVLMPFLVLLFKLVGDKDGTTSAFTVSPVIIAGILFYLGFKVSLKMAAGFLLSIFSGIVLFYMFSQLGLLNWI